MSKGKVLLVDDRPEFLDILGERIAARGYEVGRAASGGEALSAVSGQGYDAVVLDVVMPEMDGIETLKRLRELDPDLAVILLTGYGTSQEVIQALALGAQDFLVKPADLDSLLERVDEAIARKAAARG